MDDTVTPTDESKPAEVKTTPDSELGRISADLLSQDSELQELKKELSEVNESFNTFRNDYSNLLTLYNETNDELQGLLRDRTTGEAGAKSVVPDNMAELLAIRENCRELEIERDKYREMYLEAVETPASAPPPLSRSTQEEDVGELREQIRDMVDQMQELELVREEMALRLQQQAAEKDELLDDMNHVRGKVEEVEAANLENETNSQLYKEQLNVKNVVIDKLRKEFTDLGDENTRLRAQVSKFQDSSDNHDALLNSANVNNEDITKDFQALQYRCSETERREQEALLYIKDCLKLVEQTQHEKEQLVIQAAQSENMRLEVEGALGSIVDEASKRTTDEVERIKSESNKNISMLIGECGKYQERIAELEADLEEAERVREQHLVVRSPDSVLLADKDAVIYKLREHVKKTEEDKTNLTDQLLEVSNTLRASKEHFESKIRSLEFHVSTTKEKLNRTQGENQTLLGEFTNCKSDLETFETDQRTLRNKLSDVQAVLVATEKQNCQQLRELQEEENRKREEMRADQHKVVESLRQTIVQQQNDVNRLQEQQSHTAHQLSSQQSDLNSTISSLTKKLRDRTTQQKHAVSDLEKLRSQQDHDREKNFKTESRLKAVNMQLACANNQVAMVTENEAKLCSRIKELQLRIDQLEFDIERGKSSPGGVLNHSSVGNLIEQPFVPLLTSKDRSKSSRKHEKKDRKEKDQINQIFSSDIIRS
ncbi:myosin-15-like isoform X2 [Bolinopsis microptera]